MASVYEEYEPYYCNNAFPKCGLKSFLINKETREIINKDEIFAFGILMKRKYSKAFVKKGTIKIGCPKERIDYAVEYGPGRGDIQEGVFAAYSLNNIQGVAKALKNNPNSYSVRLVSSTSDQVYLIDKDVITLPTFCFYVIKKGDFEIVRYGGSEFTAHLHISPRYIRGVANRKSRKESTKDNVEEQYVFVFIYDHDLFLKRIYKKLFEIGLTKEEILYDHIQYKNIDVPFEKTVEHPFELFIKNKQFYDQHEGRIVINTKSQILKNFLHKNTIDIGSLEDICVIFDQYPAGGIESFIGLDI